MLGLWLTLSILLTLAVALAVPGFLAFASLAFWTEAGLGSVFESEWYPYAGQYGLLPAIVGSTWASILALAIAAPIGLAAAVVSAELLPARWRAPVRIGMELMAAVPAVVYGLVGLWVLLPFLETAFDLPSGHSLLGADDPPHPGDPGRRRPPCRS